MSENKSRSAEIRASCLHCSVVNSKDAYQEIFDDVGIEIGLPDLLSKYFQVTVKPDAEKSQLLCRECVNTLISFFDIDELERRQNAANAAKKNKPPPITKAVTPTAAAASAALKKGVPLAAKPTPPANKSPVAAAAVSAASAAKVAIKKPTMAKATPLPVPAAVNLVKIERPVDVRVTRGKAAAATAHSLRFPPKAKTYDASTAKVESTKRRSKETTQSRDQEQISAMIRDILNDEEAANVDDKFAEAAATVEQLEAATEELPEEEQSKEAEDGDDLEFLLEQEEDEQEAEQDESSTDSDLPPLKLEKKAASSATNESQDDSQSEDGDSIKVEPFNFVLIKDSDDIKDLYEYLSSVVKTCFESLSFDWATVCRHCKLKCGKFEHLLAHMLKSHKLPQDRYICPIEGCKTELKGRKYLAMHLVVLHAPVADIPIYGSCPECHMTFSNILQYNKHSCAHVIKKRRGIRLYCEMCGLEFPSWKRFNFHNQFHLERHRPRACFVCNYANTNIDDLFQHLHYTHEPEGTLFCDICDRNFRDSATLMEHNKSHSNVSSTTFTCNECNANFETRGRLNGHIRTTHGSLISCELCSREFATEATYNIHMKKHLIIEREVHVCNCCGLLSENHAKLLAHIEHEDSPCFGADIYVELLRDAYICEYCSAYYKQKSDLRAHRESGVHTNGVFVCQPCNKEFGDMKLYRHHIRNYQLQRADVAHRKLEICLYYMCDYEDCCEAYINWNSLYTHKRRTHDGSSKLTAQPKLAEWICQFCQKECRSKMSLSVHVARSHNNNNLICPLCKASYKDEQALQKHHAYWHEPMECNLCLKLVKNRRNYDTHMNVVHSNNKRYNCAVCEKGFYHKSEMEAHQRLHSQSYSCEQCSFTTKNKKSLSVHVLGQHYRRFAFECKICSKRFGRRQGMTNHMQRVHGSKFVCRNHCESGCNKAYNTTAQLNLHVRKVHNTSILMGEPHDEENELDMELEQQENQEEHEEVQQEHQKHPAKPVNSAKKRCLSVVKDTVEGDNDYISDSEIFEEFQEFKRKKSSPPKKLKGKRT